MRRFRQYTPAQIRDAVDQANIHTGWQAMALHDMAGNILAGWQADDAAIEDARKQVTDWMARESVEARG